MLTFLRIQNLALIDELAVEPGQGLVVFTGETGAGKSIILDGLALAVGERASLDAVRSGAEEASVEAAFEAIRDPEVETLLEEAGLSLSDGEVLVRRDVTSGRSRAYVCDSAVTVGRLKEIGDRLVDIHGQHEHQSLLSTSAHRGLLDRFAGAGEAVGAVARIHDEAVEVIDRLAGLRADDRDRAQRVDYLRFQIREIEGAELEPGEDEELEAERRRLAHAEELAGFGEEALQLLYEGDGSATAAIRQAERRLDRLRGLDEGAPVDSGALAEARFAVEEISRDLQRYLDDVTVDPKRLETVQERLAAIDRLKRKYGDSLGEVLEAAEEARRELDSLENRDEEIDELEERLQGLAERYRRAAEDLGALRREAARRLEEHVESELEELGMEGAKFRVEIRSVEGDSPGPLPPGADRHGGERIEFLLAANPGEPPRSLSKVASGGELARVMLALKLADTEGDPMETLVFDEVDAGIGGGRIAERLARRLDTMARTHQVMVVTHLPQIAAYADRHFRVVKREEGGRMRVEARALDGAERVEEIARMLGGVQITDTTREHAREMLDRS